MSKLKAELDTLVRELKSKEFYDENIKFLNLSSLEIEFEKNMNIPLKLIKEYE
jgi:hypothetical protein